MAGREPTENAVEYRLFPPLPEGLTVTEREKLLEELQDTYLAHLSQYLVEYIWQNEPFQLRIIPTSTGDKFHPEKTIRSVGPPHLYGRTEFGDNVEDEWFIVFLLQQLTVAFEGLVAKIFDSDGEFLLIEAAHHLPKWLDPDTAENRVFIYGGKLHIIPIPETPAELTFLPHTLPSIQEAIICIREHQKVTMASEKIQEDISARVADYPGKAKTALHRTHCYIPANLAAVLDHSPQLVAPIVQTFCSRDPVDLKACVTMKYFRPGTRVMREVLMTRCLYAQLVSQRFEPDKRSGFTLPSPSNPKLKAYDLGMKLAHGAEIMCSWYDTGEGAEGGSAGAEGNSYEGTRWERFHASLSKKGYFRGELEGSKLYQKLLDDARKYFHGTVLLDKETGPETGEQVLQILKSVSFDIEEMRKQESELKPPDDDKWLEISPAELDEMLQKASGLPSTTSSQSADSLDLSSVSEGVKKFVEKVSSHEGAEFPKKGEDADIQFDPNSFIQTMQKMFEFDDSDNSSTEDDMDMYASDDDMFEDAPPKKAAPKKANKSKPRTPPKPKAAREKADFEKDEPTIKDYMDIMDRELSKTEMGKSFEKQKSTSAKPKTKTKQAKQHENIRSSPKKAPKASLDEDDDLDNLDEDDDFQPVDVDINLVKNIMESLSTQEGGPGPASNILGSMGMKPPPNADH